jgi:hypothetical protein
LGRSKRKPHIFATARLLWLCELAVMPATPGVSLGTKVAIEHIAPTIRGAVVTVTATCMQRLGRYWVWDVVVCDEHEVLALCTLKFVAEIDVSRYNTRRLISKLTSRSFMAVLWLCVIDLFSLAMFLVIPIQVIYLWHSWASIVIIETTALMSWLVALTGLPSSISDWILVHTYHARSRHNKIN